MTNRWQDTIRVAIVGLALGVCLLVTGRADGQVPSNSVSQSGSEPHSGDLETERVWHSFPVVPEAGKASWLQPPVVMRPISGPNIDKGRATESTKSKAMAAAHPAFELSTPTAVQPDNAQPGTPLPGSVEPTPEAPALLASMPLPMIQSDPPPGDTAGVVVGGGQANSLPTELLDGPPQHGTRPAVIFQPAVPVRDATGHVFLRPSVRLADGGATPILPLAGSANGVLGAPSILGDSGVATSLEAMDLQSILINDRAAATDWLPAQPTRAGGLWPALSNWLRGSILMPRRGYDVGVGRERLPYALFEIDVSQPLNNMRYRFESAYDWESPDRAEYFWSKAGGRGPNAAEPSLDYQRMGFMFEIATPRFSTSTELPLVFINPTLVGNTTGLGDMAITTKTVLMDGESLQLTQILRTQLSTGTTSLGRGNGHVSMEPGMLARYKWDEDTYMHGELKFWFPLGGDPTFSGQAVRYGFGISKLWYDSDTFAAIPTLEFVGWSLVSGQRTTSQKLNGDFETVFVDGENIFNVYPGIRLANDTGGDFGMFECGISSGLCITERHWYRGLLRLDLRWSY